jgi:hypothetical protein
LVAAIRAKGARLAVPGIVDLSELADSAEGVSRIVLESIQDMLLRLALQMARDDYEDRRERQRQGIELAKRQGSTRAAVLIRTDGSWSSSCASKASIAKTAKLAQCSTAQVKRIWAAQGRSAAQEQRRFDRQGDVMKKKTLAALAAVIVAGCAAPLPEASMDWPAFIASVPDAVIGDAEYKTPTLKRSAHRANTPGLEQTKASFGTWCKAHGRQGEHAPLQSTGTAQSFYGAASAWSNQELVCTASAMAQRRCFASTRSSS